MLIFVSFLLRFVSFWDFRGGFLEWVVCVSGRVLNVIKIFLFVLIWMVLFCVSVSWDIFSLIRWIIFVEYVKMDIGLKMKFV